MQNRSAGFISRILYPVSCLLFFFERFHMKQEFKTAQLRVKAKCIIAEGGAGTIFWATPARARALLDAGAAVLMNAGPSEFKPQEPAEKKFSVAAPAGPSTDSASSSLHGAAAQSSASAEAPASPKRRSRRSSNQDET
mgnify:FL=1